MPMRAEMSEPVRKPCAMRLPKSEKKRKKKKEKKKLYEKGKEKGIINYMYKI